MTSNCSSNEDVEAAIKCLTEVKKGTGEDTCIKRKSTKRWCIFGVTIVLINSVLSAILLFLLGIMRPDPYYRDISGETNQALPPKIGALAGPESEMTHPTAHLYVNVTELAEGKLFWSTEPLEAFTKNIDLVRSGTFGCLRPNVSGIYHVYCQLTYRYNKTTSTPGHRVYQILTKRTSVRDMTLTKHTQTTVGQEYRPKSGYIYQPSFIQGYFQLNAGDNICVTASDVQWIYKSEKDSYFGINLVFRNRTDRHAIS